jgi:hypothetical protein
MFSSTTNSRWLVPGQQLLLLALQQHCQNLRRQSAAATMRKPYLPETAARGTSSAPSHHFYWALQLWPSIAAHQPHARAYATGVQLRKRHQQRVCNHQYLTVHDAYYPYHCRSNQLPNSVSTMEAPCLQSRFHTAVQQPCQGQILSYILLQLIIQVSGSTTRCK